MMLKTAGGRGGPGQREDPVQGLREGRGVRGAHRGGGQDKRTKGITIVVLRERERDGVYVSKSSWPP